MTTSQNNRGRRPFRPHVASIGFFIVVLSFIIALFLSPYSPLHAASPAAWSGDSVAYKVGDLVSYQGNTYQCLQAHTSESGWDPADTAALWTPLARDAADTGTTSTTSSVTSAPTAWSGNFISYKIGDLVSYQGSTYKCIQAHTSESGWDPADTEALWTRQAGAIDPGITPTSPTSTATPSSSPITEITPIATPAPTISVPTSNPTATPIATSSATPASTTSGGLVPVSVTFYTDQGLMADGQETHLGACAVWVKQFPLGTMIKLYDPSDLTQAVYSCTAEDTGTHICNNDIDVAMPGQVTQAIQLGVKSMQLQVVGFDKVVAQEAVANHPSSQGCELGITH